MAGLRERLLSRILCMAACISLNQRLGRPSRALVDYCVRSCGRGGNHLVVRTAKARARQCKSL